ncbi:glutathione peroxidase [Silanimonas sp.]|uniref:glutathione peroxidase n=1 Tax=Silanimonas sp. TaxID=1929290 RepID=UPI001BC06443|nr:glutathione peroxidase [Silanimonas sp.]MBS3896629.1 glutathione peroxidase [Silanimonas sp.]MBS3924238.1 glutathione peroxidase [Xanthomonadaceae bacterium]
MRTTTLARFGVAFLALGLAGTLAASVLDHSFRRLASPERVHLGEAFGGQVLLVVNTASKCGFTPQYEGLEALHQEFSARGFAVLGFPSNDFMGQEPGTEEEIREFCTLNFGVQFPMFERVVVRGREANPFFRELAAAAGEAPRWNFHKYLVGRNGEVLDSFGSRVRPEDPELRAAVMRALEAPRPATHTP